MIHPELRAAGAILRHAHPGATTRRLAALGRLTRAVRLPVLGWGDRYRVRYARRPDGSFMRLCIFLPAAGTEAVPGVLWLHGGGYAMGAPEQAQTMAAHLVRSKPCVVVAPAYRLSIEAPYPAAVDDASLALGWMRDHASEFGIRTDLLMVGGESAGGGLAAALALRMRDTGGVSLAFQMPLYPMLDDRMATPSALDNNAPLWNTRSSETAWNLYLRRLSPGEPAPAYAAPARARDLRGLPPAVTFVGELDPFRDETIAYMDAMRAAGVRAEYAVMPGCFHGFDAVAPRAEVSRDAIALVTDAFSRVVEGA